MSDTQDYNELHELQTMTVDKGQGPIRIDKFLMARMEQMSRNRLQNGIADGLITVNDKPVKTNYKVRPLDVIKVYLTEAPRDRTILPEEMDLDIIHEDEDVMVINKPPGLVVHPGVGNYSGTLVNGLAHYFQNHPLPLKEGNENDRPGLVHRIDKDTSGLMVIAKNENAMTNLAAQFFDHTIDREYLALVWSCPDPEVGTIDEYIGRHPKDRMLMTVSEDEDFGKRAITHYEVIEDLYYVSLVKCKLETGRTHQIRVHMKYKGHPLFNDKRYSGNVIRKGTVYSKYKQFVFNCFDIMPRQALHARILGFTHPTTGERLYFEQPLPDDFAGVLEKWRHYVEYKK
ncbi:MAG: RluA family pseudouridine synthase [Saprospiraceae bacterium]|jgi:23S rRNA pseudouridine1911/1915/1917 synthase|nr:RluA family pseudouridine synthase [Saprospiraceae bacterium]HAI56968.1 RNA pseudouridine synthase [Saprospirales bacterium]MDA9332648.1 RluA family pseudouridine synthase [Saprospiraceae bacterium]MDA9357957.1 RluA family pseudouridine synthase [Saprospiraceae bacterium]MDA9866218.1 RluA family pseudouridine synthase [Saprospiraceae bacterium]|tara:strand:+ start:1416 stop:2444 length:1029 start_codon:yes stop_codon:yes gene_type:complete